MIAAATPCCWRDVTRHDMPALISPLFSLRYAINILMPADTCRRHAAIRCRCLRRRCLYVDADMLSRRIRYAICQLFSPLFSRCCRRHVYAPAYAFDAADVGAAMLAPLRALYLPRRRAKDDVVYGMIRRKCLIMRAIRYIDESAAAHLCRCAL